MTNELTKTLKQHSFTAATSAASAMPGTAPDAGEGDPRAEGHHNDPHPLPGVSASAHQDIMNAPPSYEAAHTPEALAAFAGHPEVLAARQAAALDQALDTAIAMREWSMAIILQLADVAKDGVMHLDRDELEVARFILQFIANMPQRLGIAPENGHAS